MFRARQSGVALLLASAICCALAGCGTPGAPLPPSLNLPQRVTDLDAVRAGNQVTLTWTMPMRTTDKLLLKGPVTARVCWTETTAPCAPAGEKPFAPESAASFTAALPAALTSGTPRPVRFFVELMNRNQRSAGMSNPAVILAGEAPAAVTGLAAEVHNRGVVLRWTAGDPHDAIHLLRTLLNPPAKKNEGPLSAPPEPLNEDLLVDRDSGMAIDKDIRFGHAYAYRAQRVARVEVDSQTHELAGPTSAPVQVNAQDVFPPAVPTGLAAVATAAADGVPASIDLSWQPDAEPDVAGYRVYRREAQGGWERISGGQLVVGPAFHDANVQAGQTYAYGVTAVDTRGNESARSAEASDTVPQP